MTQSNKSFGKIAGSDKQIAAGDKQIADHVSYRGSLDTFD